MTSAGKIDMRLIGLGAVILLVFLILLAMQKQPRTSKGVVGVGALIIFIALVIVAALAATVMISSGQAMQNKALQTSSDTREGISTTLEIVQIRGADASQVGTPHSVLRFAMVARLSAGSNVLPLNTTILTMDTMEGSYSYVYGGNSSDLDYPATTSQFIVSYIQRGPYNTLDYVSTGDLIKVKFNSPHLIGENERTRLSVLPRTGAVNQLEFITPETMIEPSVVLWPT